MWTRILAFFMRFGLWILGGIAVIVLVWALWSKGDEKEKKAKEKPKTEISDPNAGNTGGGGNNNNNGGGGNANPGGGNNNNGNQNGGCKTETELMLEAQEAFLKKQREEAQVKKNIEEMVRNYNYTHTPIGGVGCDGSQKKTEKSSGTTIVYRERVVKEVEKPVERQVTTGSGSNASGGSTPPPVSGGCPETAMPADYKSYVCWELLTATGCHGFKNPATKNEDFRFKTFEDMVRFWDANSAGKFAGYSRGF